MTLRGVARTLAVLSVGVLLVVALVYHSLDRTPGELIRYTLRRIDGHPKLEAVLKPPLLWAREQVARPVAGLAPAPTWPGARPRTLPPIRYAANGLPVADPDGTPSPPRQTWSAQSAAELQSALRTAQPGDTILLLPGRYRFHGRALTPQNAGLPEQPITVRAAQLGEVQLEFALLEGFHVLRPYWIFENLEIEGVCADDSSCEHAFHVVAQGHSTVIRNNRLRDFNAHIKVNGADGQFPDAGLIEGNTLYNTRPRRTDNPVVPIDLVGASDWQIVDNFIADFVKAGGDRISYGAFMKGAARGGGFERNLIVCALGLQGQGGQRVGLSFGGGGTGHQFCRDGRCAYEYDEGLAINNIIAHCNDFGIDLFKASNTVLSHNTLINTAGIDVRVFPASAVISNNLLEGRIRERDGGWMVAAHNTVGRLNALLEDADQLDVRWRQPPEAVPSVVGVTDDFCGVPRGALTTPGAVVDAACLDRNE